MNTTPQNLVQRVADRVMTALVWYSPELLAAGVGAGLAVTVWAPFALVTVAVAAWVLVDRLHIALQHRAVRSASAPTTPEAPAKAGHEPGKPQRDGWGVA